MSEPTPPRSLHSLVEPDEFTRRHIGPSPEDVTAMLQVLGADSVDAVGLGDDAGLDPYRLAARSRSWCLGS